MQLYDLVMLIVLSMATIFGAIKGFAWQVASLASILVSYFVAYQYRFAVAEMIQAKPPWNQFLAMLILYVGTSFVIWVVFRLLSGAIDKVRLKEFDRHLGAAFGLAKGLIICLLITMFAMSLLGPNQQAAICQSKSGYYIATALDRGVGILPKEIHDVVGPYLTNLDTKLKNGQDGNLAGGAASEPDGAGGNGWADVLQKLPGGFSNLPDGLVDKLPNLPSGFPGTGGQKAIPNTQDAIDWQWPQNGQPAGSILPPNGLPTGQQLQELFPGFPPLSNDSPPISSPSNNSSGLRPTTQQAQRPGATIPR